MFPFAGRIARAVSEFALEEILGVSEEVAGPISKGIGYGIAVIGFDLTHVGDVVADMSDTVGGGG